MKRNLILVSYRSYPLIPDFAATAGRVSDFTGQVSLNPCSPLSHHLSPTVLKGFGDMSRIDDGFAIQIGNGACQL